MIYADNAATTQLDLEAFEAMKPYLLSEYGNASQPYSFSRTPKKALKEARESIATCINALPEEIYFTSGGTESDNWVVKGTLKYGDQREVITSTFEHHAMLNACTHIKQLGYPVVYVCPTKDGIVTTAQLQAVITEQTKLTSVMMVNNEIGTIQPIKNLCEVAHNHGSLFHTDAVQAVGHMPIDVQNLNVDLLSASAHKFNGPKGIGFLYIKKGVKIEPFSDGGAQEFGLRAGTENVAAIIGMASALKKNCCHLEEAAKDLQHLEQIVLMTLDSADLDYRRNGANPHIPGNLSLSFRNFEGEMLLHRLDLMGIMVSTGSACDSKNTQISHVLQAIGLEPEYAHGTIRISFGVNNTVDDAEQVADALIKIIKSTHKS